MQIVYSAHSCSVGKGPKLTPYQVDPFFNGRCNAASRHLEGFNLNLTCIFKVSVAPCPCWQNPVLQQLELLNVLGSLSLCGIQLVKESNVPLDQDFPSCFQRFLNDTSAPLADTVC